MKKHTKAVIFVILIVAVIGSVFAGLRFRAFAKVNGDSGPLKWAISDDGVFTVNGVGYGNNYTNALTGDNACPWRSYRSQIKTVIDRFYSRTASIHKKKSMLMATAWNSADPTPFP